MTDTTSPTALDLLKRAEALLSALHGSVARHDNLAANLGCAGCELRDQISAALPSLAVAPAVLPPAADRAAKAEALLLHFTAEAHRRKWAYDRGLDDDGVPVKSEAFDALHRLGEEMRVELEKLRRMADEEQQAETQARECPPGLHSMFDFCPGDCGAPVADEPAPTPRPETVHGCPPDGSGLTPCCGRTPFELPLADRISSEVPVTCKGAGA